MFVWDVVSSSETLNSVLITTSLCRRRLLCNRGQTLTLLKEKKHLAMTSLHGLWQKWGSTTMLVYQFLFYLLLTPTLVSFRAGSFWNITITKTQCQRYRWCSLRKKKSPSVLIRRQKSCSQPNPDYMEKPCAPMSASLIKTKPQQPPGGDHVFPCTSVWNHRFRKKYVEDVHVSHVTAKKGNRGDFQCDQSFIMKLGWTSQAIFK